MDEKTLDGAVERFDIALQDFKGTQTERIDGLEDRINEFEALRASGYYTTGDAKSAQAHRQVDQFIREGRGLQCADIDTKATDTSTPSQNGMLPRQFGRDIIGHTKDSSAMLNLVRVSQADTQNYSRIVRVAPPGSAWIAESGTRSILSDQGFRERKPTSGEIYSRVEFTQAVISDSNFDLAGFLIQDVGTEFARALDLAVVTGNGTNRPTGFLNTTPVSTADFASPLRSAEVVQSVAAPSPDSFADHLLDVYFALNSAYRRNAVWCMNSQTLAAVRKLKDSQGSFLWQPNLGSGVDANNGGLLLGHPVVVNESMLNLGASPLNFPIAVGDWTVGYEVIQIGSMRVIRDEVTNPGFVRFYVFARWGGILVNNDSIKVAQR